MRIEQISRAAVRRRRDRLAQEIAEAGGASVSAEGDDRLRLSGRQRQLLEEPALRLVIGGAR